MLPSPLSSFATRLPMASWVLTSLTTAMRLPILKGADEIAGTAIKGFLNANGFEGHVGGPSGFRIGPVTLYNIAYEGIPIRHQVSPEKACSRAFHWESVGHRSRYIASNSR